MRKYFLNRRVIITGMALFSMFFGAGNIVFPLSIGAKVGDNIFIAAIGFILSGVGVPFLALFATAQYEGDYWKFFNTLGKFPAFVLVSLLIIVIGPLSATPRTSIITYNSLSEYLPEFLNSASIFGALYFILVFGLSYRESKIVDIIGAFFSPVKIIAFICLVSLGCCFAENSIISDMGPGEAFSYSVLYGYSTMDMFGAFFFCTIAITSLKREATEKKSQSEEIMMIFAACIIGAFILASVYLGFLYLGYAHAASLRDLPTEMLIQAISHKVLGRFGGVFICISVSFACLSTAIALARVCSLFLYREVFMEKLHLNICLLIVTIGSYLTSILGFQYSLELLFPVLEIIYPFLILYCMISILYKTEYIRSTYVMQIIESLITSTYQNGSGIAKNLLVNLTFKK